MFTDFLSISLQRVVSLLDLMIYQYKRMRDKYQKRIMSINEYLLKPIEELLDQQFRGLLSYYFKRYIVKNSFHEN